MSHSSGDVLRLGSGGLSGDAAGERSADRIAVCSETAMGYCRQDRMVVNTDLRTARSIKWNTRAGMRERGGGRERERKSIHNINKKGS